MDSIQSQKQLKAGIKVWVDGAERALIGKIPSRTLETLSQEMQERAAFIKDGGQRELNAAQNDWKRAMSSSEKANLNWHRAVDRTIEGTLKKVAGACLSQVTTIGQKSLSGSSFTAMDKLTCASLEIARGKSSTKALTEAGIGLINTVAEKVVCQTVDQALPCLGGSSRTILSVGKVAKALHDLPLSEGVNTFAQVGKEEVIHGICTGGITAGLLSVGAPPPVARAVGVVGGRCLSDVIKHSPKTQQVISNFVQEMANVDVMEQWVMMPTPPYVHKTVSAPTTQPPQPPVLKENSLQKTLHFGIEQPQNKKHTNSFSIEYGALASGGVSGTCLSFYTGGLKVSLDMTATGVHLNIVGSVAAAAPLAACVGVAYLAGCTASDLWTNHKYRYRDIKALTPSQEKTAMLQILQEHNCQFEIHPVFEDLLRKTLSQSHDHLQQLTNAQRAGIRYRRATWVGTNVRNVFGSDSKATRRERISKCQAASETTQKDLRLLGSAIGVLGQRREKCLSEAYAFSTQRQEFLRGALQAKTPEERIAYAKALRSLPRYVDPQIVLQMQEYQALAIVVSKLSIPHKQDIQALQAQVERCKEQLRDVAKLEASFRETLSLKIEAQALIEMGNERERVLDSSLQDPSEFQEKGIVTELEKQWQDFPENFAFSLGSATGQALFDNFSKKTCGELVWNIGSQALYMTSVKAGTEVVYAATKEALLQQYPELKPYIPNLSLIMRTYSLSKALYYPPSTKEKLEAVTSLAIDWVCIDGCAKIGTVIGGALPLPLGPLVGNFVGGFTGSVLAQGVKYIVLSTSAQEEMHWEASVAGYCIAMELLEEDFSLLHSDFHIIKKNRSERLHT